MNTLEWFENRCAELGRDFDKKIRANMEHENLYGNMRLALLSAEVHVHRQQTAGTYETDKLDAAAWLEKNRELLSGLKGDDR